MEWPVKGRRSIAGTQRHVIFKPLLNDIVFSVYEATQGINTYCILYQLYLNVAVELVT